MTVVEMNDAELIQHAGRILAFLRDGKGLRKTHELVSTLERLMELSSRAVTHD